MAELANQYHAHVEVDADYLHVYGERALPFAPKVLVFDKLEAVPQQFLIVSRTLSQLVEILARIEVLDGYVLFAGEFDNALTIQVGIIGQENYPHVNDSGEPQGTKIVYGRRWLIEDSTPTSEVIQTALLALQKAREHELREKLSIEFDQEGHRATPFNSHQDTPLMTRADSVVTSSNLDTIEQAVSRVTFDGRAINLVSVKSISESVLLVCLRLELETQSAQLFGFTELNDRDISLLCYQKNTNALLHELVEHLIVLSNRFIAENFRFEGFNRFSHKLNPIAIAKFSFDSRRPVSVSRDFAPYFSSMSYHVDSGKAPAYNSGLLGQHQLQQIEQHDVTQGFLPKSEV